MAIKRKKDGRVILSGKDYTENKRKVWESQGRCCADCGFYVPFAQAEFDHYGASRGMAGSKRDDLDPRNNVRCGFCHQLRHWRERDAKAAMDKRSARDS